jgi:hypothetical protein
MEALCLSEMSVDVQRTTRRYIPEDSTLRTHRCENLESFKNSVLCQESKFDFHPADSHLLIALSRVMII